MDPNWHLSSFLEKAICPVCHWQFYFSFFGITPVCACLAEIAGKFDSVGDWEYYYPNLTRKVIYRLRSAFIDTEAV